ncbi:hypothetical protein ONS95_004840 [Cadophora gregata]|uniref:uncharacterized protein n=1 Tax=Cadophora gregata TaxID=51156 RepID=UPI0026DA8FA1|nr:uncharacterized protein ONS95_004840 [Cadophora gregata]KAK0104552.1 hypothetical protein ONS95_004840 [Cadophora gregata]
MNPLCPSTDLKPDRHEPFSPSLAIDQRPAPISTNIKQHRLDHPFSVRTHQNAFHSFVPRALPKTQLHLSLPGPNKFQADEAVSRHRALLAALGLRRDVVVVLPRGCWDADKGVTPPRTFLACRFVVMH